MNRPASALKLAVGLTLLSFSILLVGTYPYLTPTYPATGSGSTQADAYLPSLAEVQEVDRWVLDHFRHLWDMPPGTEPDGPFPEGVYRAISERGYAVGVCTTATAIWAKELADRGLGRPYRATVDCGNGLYHSVGLIVTREGILHTFYYACSSPPIVQIAAPYDTPGFPLDLVVKTGWPVFPGDVPLDEYIADVLSDRDPWIHLDHYVLWLNGSAGRVTLHLTVTNQTPSYLPVTRLRLEVSEGCRYVRSACLGSVCSWDPCSAAAELRLKSNVTTITVSYEDVPPGEVIVLRVWGTAVHSVPLFLARF